MYEYKFIGFSFLLCLTRPCLPPCLLLLSLVYSLFLSMYGPLPQSDPLSLYHSWPCPNVCLVLCTKLKPTMSCIDVLPSPYTPYTPLTSESQLSNFYVFYVWIFLNSVPTVTQVQVLKVLSP